MSEELTVERMADAVRTKLRGMIRDTSLLTVALGVLVKWDGKVINQNLVTAVQNEGTKHLGIPVYCSISRKGNTSLRFWKDAKYNEGFDVTLCAGSATGTRLDMEYVRMENPWEFGGLHEQNEAIKRVCEEGVTGVVDEACAVLLELDRVRKGLREVIKLSGAEGPLSSALRDCFRRMIEGV